MRERDAIDNRTTLAKLKGLLIEQEFLTSNSIADHNGSGGNPEFAPRRLTGRLIFEPLSPANQQHPRSSRHPKSKRHHRRFRIYLELFHHVTQSKKSTAPCSPMARHTRIRMKTQSIRVLPCLVRLSNSRFATDPNLLMRHLSLPQFAARSGATCSPSKDHSVSRCGAARHGRRRRILNHQDNRRAVTNQLFFSNSASITPSSDFDSAATGAASASVAAF